MSEPSIIAVQGEGILSHFPQEKDGVVIRQVQEEEVDKSYPWGFFDGAARGDPIACGGEGCLFLTDSHYFHLKSGLGGWNKQLCRIDDIKIFITFCS